ncbi:hypothetical protein BJX70DRAFT_396700 [Aspergillus crustosus]
MTQFVPYDWPPRNAHLFAASGQCLGGIFVNDPPHISKATFYRVFTHFLNTPT